MEAQRLIAVATSRAPSKDPLSFIQKQQPAIVPFLQNNPNLLNPINVNTANDHISHRDVTPASQSIQTNPIPNQRQPDKTPNPIVNSSEPQLSPAVTTTAHASVPKDQLSSQQQPAIVSASIVPIFQNNPYLLNAINGATLNDHNSHHDFTSAAQLIQTNPIPNQHQPDKTQNTIVNEHPQSNKLLSLIAGMNDHKIHPGPFFRNNHKNTNSVSIAKDPQRQPAIVVEHPQSNKLIDLIAGMSDHNIRHGSPVFKTNYKNTNSVSIVKDPIQPDTTTNGIVSSSEPQLLSTITTSRAPIPKDPFLPHQPAIVEPTIGIRPQSGQRLFNSYASVIDHNNGHHDTTPVSQAIQTSHTATSSTPIAKDPPFSQHQPPIVEPTIGIHPQSSQHPAISVAPVFQNVHSMPIQYDTAATAVDPQHSDKSANAVDSSASPLNHLNPQNNQHHIAGGNDHYINHDTTTPVSQNSHITTNSTPITKVQHPFIATVDPKHKTLETTQSPDTTENINNSKEHLNPTPAPYHDSIPVPQTNPANIQLPEHDLTSRIDNRLFNAEVLLHALITKVHMNFPLQIKESDVIKLISASHLFTLEEKNELIIASNAAHFDKILNAIKKLEEYGLDLDEYDVKLDMKKPRFPSTPADLTFAENLVTSLMNKHNELDEFLADKKTVKIRGLLLRYNDSFVAEFSKLTAMVIEANKPSSDLADFIAIKTNILEEIDLLFASFKNECNGGLADLIPELLTILAV